MARPYSPANLVLSSRESQIGREVNIRPGNKFTEKEAAGSQCPNSPKIIACGKLGNSRTPANVQAFGRAPSRGSVVKNFGNGKEISIFIPKYLSLCQSQAKI